MKTGKQNRTYQWLWRILAGLLGYGFLVGLLALAESQNPDSAIQSISDALWYSIVTLSTVGYGDMYPTTMWGRLVGMCFILMSLGVLAFIMGTIVNFFTGRMLPALRLRLLRKKNWFVFSDVNMESLALAEDLERIHPEAVFLFPKGGDDALIEEKGYHLYSETMAHAVAGKQDACTLFFMDETRDHYQKAIEALTLGFPVVCCTEHMPDGCPEGLTLYNRYDGCAQEYWRDYVPARQEKTIVLIGGGRYGAALLELGLTVNVFAPDHRISYHVFGDWDNFLRNHTQLDATLAVNRSLPGMDVVYFHETAWNDDSDLLKNADRIILCSDTDTQNLAILRQIRRYFPINGSIHIRAGSPIPGEQVFGTDRESYTADLVLRGSLTKAARMLHQIYVDSTGGNTPAWEELNDFTRRSNIAAAEHMRIKIRMLLEDESITEITSENCAAAYSRYLDTNPEKKDIYRSVEHLRWMRFHSLFNWQYAPVRDNAARKHTMMVPYEQLSLPEQEKDDYAWELLGSVAKYLAAEK